MEPSVSRIMSTVPMTDAVLTGEILNGELAGWPADEDTPAPVDLEDLRAYWKAALGSIKTARSRKKVEVACPEDFSTQK